MMHRSGWATIFDPDYYPGPQAWAAAKDQSPVRVQWDPDRTLTGQQMDRRAIQVGLFGEAATHYVREWIRAITDITAITHAAHALVTAGHCDDAAAMLASERIYPVARALAASIGADTYDPTMTSNPENSL